DITDGVAPALELELVPPGELLRVAGGLHLEPGLAAAAGRDRVVACRADGAELAAALAGGLDGATVFASKELLRFLRDHGHRWAAPPRDLSLGAYLLDPGEEISLEAVSRRHLEVLPPDPHATDLEAAAAGRDALWTAAAAERVFERVEAEGLGNVYEEIEAPLVPVLESMERWGIRVDLAVLDELSRRLGASLAGLEREIHAEAGEPFNINSPQQLAVILFERLGYPVIKRTAKTRRPSTGVEVLKELAGRGYRLPALILEYREQAKLKSTYVDALPRQVAADGRIHTRFHQTVTATGRLSSSDPNLQNIPIRTELGREVRRAFVADDGWLLVAADYSQIELRVLAHMSGDETLVAAFRAGEDIHRATAAAVLGKRPADITPAERRAAKTVNFGLIYGMGAFSLARDLGVSQAEAQQFIDAYFTRFPGVKAYMDGLREQARRAGKVTTLFGRVRRIANLDHPSAAVRAAAERMAINAPIQGTAADIIKLAMIAVHRWLENHDARLLLQVHDELVLEAPAADAPTVARELKRIMEGVVTLDVPLTADTAHGPSWYEAK
ncbi:MAG TPA: DNA polymerase I, partial [Acidobacteria bacterium]|nr:DNA polymerase I [Acidobacteriota bacterium]